MRSRWLAAPVLAAAVIGLAACGSSATSSSGTTPASPAGAGGSSSTSSAGSGLASGIKTASTSVGTVLVDSKGFVIYWFAIDTPTKSNCSGTCASYWPPVTGTPSAAAGVSLSGKFGTIKRSDGTTQATYMGHPLYLYKGDTSPGAAGGNGLNISGGLWYAMTPSGAKPTAGGAPAPSTSTSSGGYGY
jgi:predicted lipoprotein with Yx(FWY)xxD motif